MDSLKSTVHQLLAYRRYESYLHGPAHWVRVHRFGSLLSGYCGLPETERHCVEIFALTHDLGRVDDNGGNQHALDGADYFREYATAVFPDMEDRALDWVETAIRHHSDGLTADVADRQGLFAHLAGERESVRLMIGCCWDADRLDLLRLGMSPRAEKMSTPYWEAVLPLALKLHGNGEGSEATDESHYDVDSWFLS